MNKTVIFVKEIIPVLEQLKNFGLKIGLVSNCYIEEALIIKDSILYKYFDNERS